MERRPGFVGPLLLITIGLILLSNKLGLLQWVSWGSLWQFWPVILILWGIEILARHTESDVIYFMAVFLSILLIIVTVFLASNGYPPADKTGDNLRGIIFNNGNFEDKEFNFADLKYAYLSNAVLDGANLNFVDLDGANLTGARLKGANLAFAGTSKSTICPDSTNGPCW